MTRRELVSVLLAAPVLGQEQAPTAPVAIARCRSYDEPLIEIIRRMFDQIGGAERLVRNKTVTIKLNLTGSPGLRFQGKPLGVTHYTHPKTIAAMVHVLGQAGAKRIRLVESCWATGGPLEEYMLNSGWNPRQFTSAAPAVEFENTNARGSASAYKRLKTPHGGRIYPAFDLNHSYHDTDVFVSMAKLKNHATCGVTLTLKNVFGITPASIYGDDAGKDEPNENPTKGRGSVCHAGSRQPSRSAPAELDPSTSRDQGYRVPRITVDLVAARPIDIAFIDGVQTITGGEGPWIRTIGYAEPGLLFLGTNPVTTDAVATAAMGYSPRATRGTPPFTNGDNLLLLAEQARIGTADLKRIEVVGLPLRDAIFRFPA